MNLHRPILLATIVAALSGCIKEPSCSDVQCENGACDPETALCMCNDGYEGSACQTLQRDKFIGDWRVGDICTSAAEVYDASIAADTGLTAITILGLHQGSPEVEAQVSGNQLEIPMQTYLTGTITGSGSLDTAARVLSIDYTIDLGNGQAQHCLATFEQP